MVKYRRLEKFLSRDERILDVGTGNGALAVLFRENGYDVTPMDVADKSRFDQLSPVVYDGRRFPFADNSFDTVLIITVLHHTPDPMHIVREASRVAREKVVIMEDIYFNILQKYVTFFFDSLNNMEFRGHPHTNRTDRQWRDAFLEAGLKVEDCQYYRFLVVFSQVTYVLKKGKAE
jgi:ubiquinone/menaquinone biosynthesis C-methylase UbiE